MNRSTRSQVLIFDLGGVLIANDLFDELPRIMKQKASETELKNRWLRSEAVRNLELGRSSPEHFSEAMVEEFELTVSASEFIDQFAGWPSGFFPGIIDLLTSLRKRHQVGCLSNSNEVHWKSDFTAHFDVSYSSHLLGRIKPDVEVFEYVTSDLGSSPDQVTFFDDSILNVEAANEYGWQAHHTDGPGDLLQVIRQLGLLS